jgi:hypothetical protein
MLEKKFPRETALDVQVGLGLREGSNESFVGATGRHEGNGNS